MASKPNTARQHKHFAVLIDADNAPFAIVEVFKRWTSFVMYPCTYQGYSLIMRGCYPNTTPWVIQIFPSVIG